jgi:hypothetical protein
MPITNERELHERIDIGIKKGVARAINEHKKAGRSITIWQNGKVEKIPPEKIGVKE